MAKTGISVISTSSLVIDAILRPAIAKILCSYKAFFTENYVISCKKPWCCIKQVGIKALFADEGKETPRADAKQEVWKAGFLDSMSGHHIRSLGSYEIGTFLKRTGFFFTPYHKNHFSSFLSILRCFSTLILHCCPYFIGGGNFEE